MRKLRRLSQTKIAKALTAQGQPTTQQSVSEWDRGLSRPSEDRHELLPRVLDCSEREVDEMFPLGGSL